MLVILTFVSLCVFGTLVWLLTRSPITPQPGITAHPIIRLFRMMLGWICIVAGLILFPLPLPLGIPLMLVGTLLIGRRHPILRRSGVYAKLLLRRWAALRVPLIGPAGRQLLRAQRQISCQLRRYRWRRMRQE